MANVIINDTNLTNIANAIREKNGGTTKYKPSEMANAILAISAGGFDIPESALANYVDNGYRFYGNGWTWFLTEYGDLMESPQNGGVSMFENNTTLKEIPFTFNLGGYIDKMFKNCTNLTALPKDITPAVLNDVNINNVSQVFLNCYLLREIPDDFFGTSGKGLETNTARNNMFQNCYSLRELPDLTYVINLNNEPGQTLYYCMAENCYALNKISNLPVSKAELNENVFNNIVSGCYKLTEFTFKPEETANWTNQTIVFSNIGYATDNRVFLKYNSGISANKEIYSYNTYFSLKDDLDSWTVDYRYSRYNKNSAIATINSLPDTSAYLAANGGTNTILFAGNLGSNAGGAINTMTEEQIAVAVNKGWTVSFT